MVSEEELENGAKGTIEEHIHYKEVSIAFGYSDDGGTETPLAYIYNIPQESVDRGFLAVRASENGGSNPEVAEPSAFEYAVGFDCFNCTREEMEEICTKTIEDIGHEPTEEDTDEIEPFISNVPSTQEETETQPTDTVETIDIEFGSEQNTEQTAESEQVKESDTQTEKETEDTEEETDVDASIDLSDEF